MLHPDDPRMPHHLRKAEAEVVLREALGERLTVLRPAAYHQNLLGQARTGMLSVPYSLDAPFTNVDLDDVADVAADALLGAHPGLTLDLAGPEVLTTRQMTEEAAAALGRPVSDTHVSLAEWLSGPGAELDEQARTTSPPCSRPTTRAAWSVTPGCCRAARTGADDLDDLRVTVPIGL